MLRMDRKAQRVLIPNSHWTFAVMREQRAVWWQRFGGGRLRRHQSGVVVFVILVGQPPCGHYPKIGAMNSPLGPNSSTIEGGNHIWTLKASLSSPISACALRPLPNLIQLRLFCVRMSVLFCGHLLSHVRPTPTKFLRGFLSFFSVFFRSWGL